MTAANRIVEREENRLPDPDPETPVSSIPAETIDATDRHDAQRESAMAAIQEQQLQPSMLPKYYQKNPERSALVDPEPMATEERIRRVHKASGHRFLMSKTCANASLPLKAVKLANPFPEPVKTMMSRTVSDDEKAEQMLAEAKGQRAFATTAPHRPFSAIKRWYSKSAAPDSGKGKKPDSEQCKKTEQKQSKPKCPKMKLKDCPVPPRKKCTRAVKHSKCTKQEAPYPAYSEFCHEELEDKTSECKVCPWKMEDNPHFKPQKKNVHTSAQAMVKRSGLEVVTDDNLEGMLCDLRKPDCERPKSSRCPPSKKDKKKEKEVKKKEKPKKTDCSRDLAFLLDDVVLPVDDTEILVSKKGGKEPKKPPTKSDTKIKKFQFPGCDEKKEKVEKKEDRVNKTGQEDFPRQCPPKKKKPKIRDCPPSGGGKTGCQSFGKLIEAQKTDMPQPRETI